MFLIALITTIHLSTITVVENPLLPDAPTASTIESTFSPPNGYTREVVSPDSFAAWIRKLPLKAHGAKVIKYDGKPLWYQYHANRIIDMDVGARDLMQCADFLIRLRAEYAFSQDDRDIAFHFTSGDLFTFENWLRGKRPVVKGNSVKWRKTSATIRSASSLNQYLQTIYMYAGTVSLMTETQPVKLLKNIRIGDILLEPGFPGHTMMIADLAINKVGDTVAMFIEGSTPAQSPHVVNDQNLFRTTVWIPIKKGQEIETAIWTFKPEHLRRFN